ncbi:unnamed protein product, partial [Allacma fusca]
RPGGKPKTEKFQWGKTPLKCTTEYKYLGVLFSQSGSSLPTLKDFIARGRMALAALWPMFIKAKLPLSKTHFALFNSMVKSVVTYGAGIWGLQHLGEIDKLQHYFVKKLLRLPKNTPAFFLNLEFKLDKISVSVVRSALLLWLRCLQSYAGNYANDLLKNCYVDMWNEKPEDCKYSWSSQLFSVIQNHIPEELWVSKDPVTLRAAIPTIISKYKQALVQSDVLKMQESTYFPMYKRIKT